MKNYRFFGDEMEVLGNRLDHARARYNQATQNSWAKNYWRQVVDSLLLQWRQLPILHDSDAQVTIIPRWTVEYDFYESTHMSQGYGFTDRTYDKLFKHNAELDSSWHAHREARLAKAQY
jgi:hypothetical protein